MSPSRICGPSRGRASASRGSSVTVRTPPGTRRRAIGATAAAASAAVRRRGSVSPDRELDVAWQPEPRQRATLGRRPSASPGRAPRRPSRRSPGGPAAPPARRDGARERVRERRGRSATETTSGMRRDASVERGAASTRRRLAPELRRERPPHLGLDARQSRRAIVDRPHGEDRGLARDHVGADGRAPTTAAERERRDGAGRAIAATAPVPGVQLARFWLPPACSPRDGRFPTAAAARAGRGSAPRARARRRTARGRAAAPRPSARPRRRSSRRRRSR